MNPLFTPQSELMKTIRKAHGFLRHSCRPAAVFLAGVALAAIAAPLFCAGQTAAAMPTVRMTTKPPTAPAAGRAAPGVAFHPSRIMVKPKEPSVGAVNDLARVHAQTGARVLQTFPGLGGWQVIELPGVVDIKGAVEDYLRSGVAGYAEPDYEVSLGATPNDPQYLSGALWALRNTGQNGGVFDADIDAPEAWDLRTGAVSVVVAVIDTGIRWTHEDLAANLWTNPQEIAGNGIDDDGNGYIDDVHGINAINHRGDPDDDNGHGTHVAGIIGAVGNNGLGVVGVAWRVQLMACKFIGVSGSGYTSDAIRCMEYARAQGAHVMNASWGGLAYVQALKDAVDAAGRQGIMVVAAAGNSGSDTDSFFPMYPADFSSDNLVTVASTTRSDELHFSSNWGLWTVDVGAPGTDIASTWFTADDAYTVLSGTSMAAPCVSGVMALLRAEFPGESYRQLYNRLYASVDRLPALANKCRTGGRVNLARALGSASSAPGNDSFANRLSVNLDNFSIAGINVDATAESQEPAHAGNSAARSIWWSWRPSLRGVATLSTAGSSFSTALAVYTGAGVSSLTLVAANDDDPAGGTNTSRVSFDADPAVDYAIAVDGLEGASGSVVLNAALLTRPLNDHFAGRFPILGSVATVTGSNTVATLEPGEPLHAGQPGGSSVWWSWTAAASEPVTMSTAGSSFNTLLAVYTGAKLSNLKTVAANDDDPAGGTNTSRLSFTAVAGTPYHIAVDGYQGASGSIVLRTPPLNDHFVHRISIPGAASTIVGYNELASKESLEPNHAGNAGGKSLWWSWTCPASGPVTISTLGSTFDTLLAVYTGAGLGSLTLMAANDNGPFGGSSSLVAFDAIAGATYHLAVDGAGGGSGQVKLVLGSRYVITDLGDLGSDFVFAVANGMNERNQVVGYCYNYPGYLHQAFLWSDGVMQPLGTLGGSESHAMAINDLGQVVGWARSATGRPRAFLWQNGVMRDLGSFQPNTYSEAWSINNAGQVVGFSVVNSVLHGFLWQEEIMTDLTPAGSSRCWAMAINQSGHIVGQNGWAPSQYVHPFIWRDGRMSMLEVPQSTISGEGRAINSYDQVVGDYYTDQDYAFQWDHGVFRDLGLLPGGLWAKATGMNDAGQVVGQADTRAFLWQGDRLIDLNNHLPPQSGWLLFGANAINSRGQIVGWGTFNGRTRAFLMTPTLPSLPVPYLASPTNGQTSLAGATIPLEVLLPAGAPELASVAVAEGGVLLSAVTNAPSGEPLLRFRGVWPEPLAGAHAILARAAYTSGLVTTSGTVAVSVVLPPSLICSRAGSELQLAWPASPAAFLLETTTNLSFSASWLPVTNAPDVLDGTNYVNLGLTDDIRFFRLRHASAQPNN